MIGSSNLSTRSNGTLHVGSSGEQLTIAISALSGGTDYNIQQ